MSDNKTFGKRAVDLIFKLANTAAGLAIFTYGAYNWYQDVQATPRNVALILLGLTWAAVASGATKKDWWLDEGFRFLRFFAGLCILASGVYMGILADPQRGFWWALLALWGIGIFIFELFDTV